MRLGVLAFVAIVLFLAIAGPALADAIIVDAGPFSWDGSYPHTCPHGSTEGMWGPIGDQDPNAAGTQIAVVTTQAVNCIEYHWIDCEGAEHVSAQQTVGPTSASGFPQIITVSAYSSKWPRVRPHDRDPLQAYEAFHTGHWVFYYVNGGTSEPRILPPFILAPITVSDPVELQSGGWVGAATDLPIPGIGLPLVFSRSYNSDYADHTGPLGYGWTHAYASRLQVLSTGVIYAIATSGKVVPYTSSDGGATYTPPAGVFDTLAKLASGSYVLTTKGGTVYAYSSTGLLTSITDRYGNATTLTYTGSALTSVTDGSGRSLALTYTSGRLTLVEAQAGGITQQSVSFTYDVNGNLATATDANGHTTGYVYDSSHRLVSEREPKAMADPTIDPLFANTWLGGRVSSQTDALGHTTSMTYDPVTPGASVTDARGNDTTYAWDSAYRAIGATDPLGGSIAMEYGLNGLPARVIDANDGVTSYEYDVNGNATSVHDQEGHVSRVFYDENNNPLWVQDALGERLSRTSSGIILRDDFSTDSLANYAQAKEGTGNPAWSFSSGILSQGLRYYATQSLRRSGVTGAACVSGSISPTYGNEAQADLLGLTGALDSTTKAFLGYSARVTKTSATLYKRVDGSWASLANQSYSTPLGTFRNVRLYADAGVVQMRVGSTDLSAVNLSASDGSYTSGSGGVRASSRASFDWIELRSSHTVTVTGLPDGYVARVSKGAQTAQAAASSGTAVIDAGSLLFPLDKIEIFDTSAMKVAELTSLDLADMGGGDVFCYDGSVGHRTTFAWDATGTFLDSVTSPIGTTSFDWNTDGTLDSVTDAENHTWEYGYNACGDLTTFTDPLSYVTSFEYDAVGRTTAVEDANSSRTEFTYDAVGNVTAVKDPLAEGDPLNRHQLDFTYDANDNVTEVEDARGNLTTFSYDDMNCLLSVTDPLSGQAEYTYDGCYNLTGAEDPRGYTTTYGYDSNNRLASVTDPLSRATTYAYDPAGNVSGVSYPNGNDTTHTYTADDLVASTSYSSESTSWSFTYDSTDALVQAERNDGKTWAFTYDAGNRLAAASDENNATLGLFSFTYGYDDVSNLTTLDPGPLASRSYVYNGRNELTEFSGPGGVITFDHDDGGRLTEITTPDGSTRSLSYDAAGRLTEASNTTGSGTQASPTPATPTAMCSPRTQVRTPTTPPTASRAGMTPLPA